MLTRKHVDHFGPQAHMAHDLANSVKSKVSKLRHCDVCEKWTHERCVKKVEASR